NFKEYTSKKNYSQIILSQIRAPLGKYAVFGNHDRGGGGGNVYEQYMKDAGFTVLVNQTQKIIGKKGDYITITGLDDFLLGEPNVQQTLQPLQKKDFNLLLVHEPDVVNQFLSYPIDFQMSGHSHGGQVRLPFVGPIITTSLAHQYVEGLY
ncbi:metallophosphoesterase, partial [Bacillus wiedmannii]|uniref:metallophosphoesterase n=1 Tax=Bacillus wiedmannii TaxID=1890302 RepID=UPI00352B6FBB